MGAGCFYTNKENNKKAFWIDLDLDLEDENGDLYDDELMGIYKDELIEDVKSVLQSIGYIDGNNDNELINNLYTLTLETTYYGDGLIVYLNPDNDGFDNIYNLALGSFDRNYKYVAKTLCKAGYKLRIASSGNTSTPYNPFEK